MGLKGKCAIVTGAARGIGRAIAERFAHDGANVVVADIDEEAGEATAADIAAKGGKAMFVRCDVSQRLDVRNMVTQMLNNCGHIDVLVNNAGIGHSADFLDLEEADYDRVMGVNLKGAFLVGQAVARQMVAQGGGGAIVQMSSVNGVMAIPTIASYNASKGGINQLTRAMALALADHRIRVNAVAPGTIATELARQAVLTSDEARLRILGRTPMKRLGEPGEVADVVAWLLSDAASYVTGEIVTVDGGRLALNYTVPV